MAAKSAVHVQEAVIGARFGRDRFGHETQSVLCRIAEEDVAGGDSMNRFRLTAGRSVHALLLLLLLSGCMQLRVTSDPSNAKVYTQIGSGFIWEGSGDVIKENRWEYRCSTPCDFTGDNQVARVVWPSGEKSEYQHIGAGKERVHFVSKKKQKKMTKEQQAAKTRRQYCSEQCSDASSRCYLRCGTNAMGAVLGGSSTASINKIACEAECDSDKADCNENCK